MYRSSKSGHDTPQPCRKRLCGEEEVYVSACKRASSSIRQEGVDVFVGSAVRQDSGEMHKSGKRRSRQGRRTRARVGRKPKDRLPCSEYFLPARHSNSAARSEAWQWVPVCFQPARLLCHKIVRNSVREHPGSHSPHPTPPTLICYRRTTVLTTSNISAFHCFACQRASIHLCTRHTLSLANCNAADCLGEGTHRCNGADAVARLHTDGSCATGTTLKPAARATLHNQHASSQKEAQAGKGSQSMSTHTDSAHMCLNTDKLRIMCSCVQLGCVAKVAPVELEYSRHPSS